MVDDAVGIARPAVELAVGSRDYAAIKDDLSVQAVAFTSEAFDDPAFNAERAVVVERVMREKMRELTSAEFQGLLRPAFKEEELKLILVGAALGGLTGLGQVLLVFT